ncbi:MAG: hypothetical protein JWO06_2441 [Bacteroidota bacterium]|nr:hypothetical protein [Bacteroidota bacterium]
MTKKKEKAPAQNKWLQSFLAIAGNIAPKTTIRVITKLMYSPTKRPLRPSHIECLNKAEKFKFLVPEFRNPKKKIKLSCYSWGTGNKTVLLVHGWDAKALDFYKLIPALVDNGYKVVTFDGPGHGVSEGDRTNLVDFKEVMYKMIKEKIGIPYAIIGHSMGGGAAAYLLMDYDIKVKRLITITIPTVSKRYFEGLFAAVKAPLKLQKAFYQVMEEEFGEPIERYNLIERKEPIKAENILWIYDEDDEVVSIKDIRDFLVRRPQIKQLNVKGVGHYAVIKNKHVIEEIVSFLK